MGILWQLSRGAAASGARCSALLEGTARHAPETPRAPQCHTGRGAIRRCLCVTMAPWHCDTPVSQRALGTVTPFVTQPRALPWDRTCPKRLEAAGPGTGQPLRSTPGDLVLMGACGDPPASRAAERGAPTAVEHSPFPFPSSREGPGCPEISALLCSIVSPTRWRSLPANKAQCNYY